LIRWVLFFLMALPVPLWASSVCLKDVCVNVDVVSTPQDLQKGLQGKAGLAENQGMLFVFDEDTFEHFWMKDMKFAIDMIWIDSQKRIVTIEPSRPPCLSEPCEIYSPSNPARYVLEVSSGFALKHQLKPGDVFEFKDIN
jgi:uncharacterized membrane protein (UPF0127 family)